jgi:hypothetical protein
MNLTTYTSLLLCFMMISEITRFSPLEDSGPGMDILDASEPQEQASTEYVYTIKTWLNDDNHHADAPLRS